MSHSHRAVTRCRLLLAVGCCAAVMGSAVPAARGDVTEAAPVRDNTLFSTETTSSGAGDAIFSGRTGMGGGGVRQRAVLAFDVAAVVPAGSTITSATLHLEVLASGGAPVPRTHTLHRLLADWGEGASPGGGGNGAPAARDDATWLHRYFPGVLWATEGGDFAPASSGSAMLGAPGPVSFGSTASMVADVQSWLDDPGASFGWLILGNETDFNTARRMASREAESVETRPRLVLEFDPPCPADLTGDGAVNSADLVELILDWGCTSPPDACAGDINDDGVVSSADIVALILAWGGCS